MKILFLTYHGFEEASGISKKMLAQIKGLRQNGHEVHVCSYALSEQGERCRYVDGEVLKNYGRGRWATLRQRMDLGCVADYCIANHIELVYVRSFMNASPFNIHLFRRLRRNGIPSVMEIPTYPYDKEFESVPLKYRFEHIFDKLFRRRLAACMSAIVTFSDEKRIFGQRTINISNGIDPDTLPLQPEVDASNEVHLIGVAEVHPWHGFDRMIHGLGLYYSLAGGAPRRPVYFHVVGDVSEAIMNGDKYQPGFRHLIEQYHIERNVVFHGKLFGTALDQVFAQCAFAVGSLARHRSGITNIKTLKNREYACRGIPFVYSENDSDFDHQPYVLKVPADESPIDVQQILSFIDQRERNGTFHPADIRQTVEHLSWNVQMGEVVKKLQTITSRPTGPSPCPSLVGRGVDSSADSSADGNYSNDKSIYSPPYKGGAGGGSGWSGGAEGSSWSAGVGILYVIDSLASKGGAERVLTDKMNYMVAHWGYKVFVVTCYQDIQTMPNAYQLSEAVQQVNLNIPYYSQYHYRYPRRLWVKWRLYRQLSRDLKAAVDRIGPDVLVGLSYFNAHLVSGIRCRALKVTESHEARPFTMSDAGLGRSWCSRLFMRCYKKWYFSRVERQSDVVVALTQGDARYWQRARRVAVIPNFTMLPTCPPGDVGSAKCVIAVGRLEWQKGFDRLIDAWALVEQGHPDWQLHIFGSGTLEAELQQRIASAGLYHVDIYPFTSAIGQEYGRSAIFVLSSRWEGFGLVLLEAMRAGLPCVVFDCPYGPAEVVEDGRSGFVVSDGDVQQFSARIGQLIDDDQLRRTMGMQAMERAKQFDADTVMAQWKQLFEQAISKETSA